MAKLLVIGWGNPMRGDDGFGFLAAERLQSLLPADEAEVLALHQLTPELMETVAQAEAAIFIDVSESGEPGALTRTEVVASTNAEAFTHHATPGGLLAGARSLYGTAPRAELYSVRGESFDFGAPLSEAVRRALDEVVGRIVG
jgi:hydrogenase maturation protease